MSNNPYSHLFWGWDDESVFYSPPDSDDYFCLQNHPYLMIGILKLCEVYFANESFPISRMETMPIDYSFLPEKPLHTVVVECNTFDFFVISHPKHKSVWVRQTTDFTGTILEEDFPNGDNLYWEGKVWTGYSDIEAINIVAPKLLKDWQPLEETNQ